MDLLGVLRCYFDVLDHSLKLFQFLFYGYMFLAKIKLYDRYLLVFNFEFLSWYYRNLNIL